MTVIKLCKICGKSFNILKTRLNQNRGIYCSKKCKFISQYKSDNQKLITFTRKYNRNPEELTKYLQSTKTTLTIYSNLISIPIGTLSKDFQHFGVKAYKKPLKKPFIFVCQLCDINFFRFERPSIKGRIKFCSTTCMKKSKRKSFQENLFRIKNFHFLESKNRSGNYNEVLNGDRIRKFVNKNKVNHFFFKNGIIDEKTAYIFGILLTDGSVGRGSNGGYIVRIGLTDYDIVEKIKNSISYKNSLNYHVKRKVYTINISSPYLFHDLSVLGCIPNKTYSTSYPLILNNLDKHFIRGVIDGDGSWWLSDGKLLLSICGSDLLLYGIFLKIKKHLYIIPQSLQYPRDWDNRHRRKMTSFATIRYNTTDSIKIREWIYKGATIYGGRKYEKAHSTELPYTERFTTKKLALYLGVAEDFIKKNIRKYNLPHSNVGPYYYFEENHIEQWQNFLKNRLKDTKCKFPNRNSLRSKWLGSNNDLE